MFEVWHFEIGRHHLDKTREWWKRLAIKMFLGNARLALRVKPARSPLLLISPESVQHAFITAGRSETYIGHSSRYKMKEKTKIWNFCSCCRTLWFGFFFFKFGFWHINKSGRSLKLVESPVSNQQILWLRQYLGWQKILILTGLSIFWFRPNICIFDMQDVEQKIFIKVAS